MTRLRSWLSAGQKMPLRVQLMIVVLSLVIAALLITGFTATSALQDSLLERVDTQLDGTARDQSRRGFGEDARANPGLRGNQGGPALLSGFYTLIVDEAGSGIGQLRTPEGVEQSPPKLPDLDSASVSKFAGKPFTVPAEEGDGEWRVLVTPYDDGRTYVAAVELSDVQSTVGRLERTIVIVSLAILFVLGILGYFLVRSRLRKLEEVERTAERIAAGDLSQRVPNSDIRTEVGRVAGAINVMMTRVEASFKAQQESEAEARTSEARMRRFVADASHELRTPLTSIRGFAELSRQSGNPHVDTPHAMSRIESEAKRMGVLVEDLLMLARIDQARPLEAKPVDLYDIVDDAVIDAPATGPDHRVGLEVEERARAIPMIVMGDEARLRQVVTNLMANAYAHTPAGTDVIVRLSIRGDNALIEVADNGPGMESGDAARVFERFYRSDPSRNRARGGSGLGLSIVAGLVEAHGGSVDVETVPGQGATFRVYLPLVPTDDDG